MPQLAAGAIASELVAAELILAAEAAAYATAIEAAFYVVLISASMADARRKAKNANRDAQQDRLANISSTVANRDLVLGRVRKGGQIFYSATTGNYNSRFVICIAIAGHEVDAFEQFYLNDLPVTLDGSGWVQEEPHKPVNVPTPGTGTFVAGHNVITLPVSTAIASSFVCTYGSNAGSGESYIGTETLLAITSLSGATLVIDAPEAGTFVYQYLDNPTSFVKIRSYLGAPGQTADAALMGYFPSDWLSTAKATNVAYAIMEMDFNEVAFANGVPTLTVVTRGAKVYKASTGTTVWSANPVWLQRHVLTHPYFGKRTKISAAEDARMITQAAACDTATIYTVNGVAQASRPLYEAGISVPFGTAPRQVLDDLSSAMAGRWAYAQGQFFTRAGVFSASIESLSDLDLAGSSRTNSGQVTSNQIQISPHKPRADKINSASVRIFDASQGYKQVPLLPLRPSALIAKDGIEIAQELQFAAITYGPQALHVAGVMIRDSRDPLTITATFKLTAYVVELFDTVDLTLARFGWTSKLFEVVSRKWAGSGAITLTLKETASAIYQPDANFLPGGFAANTNLPSPYSVPTVALVSAVSGDANCLVYADGSVEARVLVTWTAITSLSVTQSGKIEVEWKPVRETSWIKEAPISGDSTSMYIRNAPSRSAIVIRARAVTNIAPGDWSVFLGHVVTGKSATLTTPSVTNSVASGTVDWTWVRQATLDYAATEVRTSDANWGATSPAPLYRGQVNHFYEFPTVAGTLTRYFRHFNTSGNMSATASSAITVRDIDIVLNAAGGVKLNVTGTGLVLAGNSCDRPTGGGGWDSQCYSTDGFIGGAACSFIGNNGGSSYFMAGLNSDPTTNASYTSIDYAFYVDGGGFLQIYESNVGIGSFGTYAANDVLTIVYDSQFVRYTKNGTLLRTVAATSGLKLFFDSSIVNFGLKNIQFQPYANTNNARGLNLVDASWWKKGPSPTAVWTAATDGGTDQFVNDTLPDGSSAIVWQTTSGASSGSSVGGGWDWSTHPTNRFPVDINKTYIFAVYSKAIADSSGYHYFGIAPGDVCDLNTTTPQSNPYFGNYNRVAGEWHVIIGWVFAAGTTGNSNGTAGVYKCSNGALLASGTNFNWNPAISSSSIRAFQYYQNSGSIHQFVWPMAFLCDGSEPSIDDLLSMTFKGNIALAATTAVWTGVTGSGRPSDNATADIVFVNPTPTTLTITGNKALKPAAAVSGWNTSSFYTKDSFTGGAFVSFVADQTGTQLMVGLNSDPSTDNNYASIDYAIFLESSNVYAYESGSGTGVLTTFSAGDVFAVVYDGWRVRYFKNGNVIRTVVVTIASNLFGDSSFNTPGCSVSNIRFGPLTSGAWEDLGGRPANVAALTGTEGINNDLVQAAVDAATAGGSNPRFKGWAGAGFIPPSWNSWSGPAAISSAGVATMQGLPCPRWVTTAGEVGLYADINYTSNPLPAGTFIQGALDIFLNSRTSGLPGILVRLFTNSARTSQEDTTVQPFATTGQWQRIPFTARATSAIYGVRVYVMPSWTGFPSGGFTGDVVFGGFTWDFFTADTDAGNKIAVSITKTVYLIKATVPSTPSNGSYNFNTSTLTVPTTPDTWVATQPAASTVGPTYRITTTFKSTSPTGTDSAPVWTAPEVVAAAVYVGIKQPLPDVSSYKSAGSGTVTSGIRLKTTGRIARKDAATGTAYTDYSDWYLNGTPGTFYVMFTVVTQSGGTITVTGGSVDTWYDLASDRTVTLLAGAGTVASAVLNYFISTTASADGVVGSATILLDSEAA